MKKSFGTKMKVWALGALSIVASGAFTGCSDEIPEESRFTFTGELIADHLKNNPDKYKNFCEILKKAKINKKGGNMLTTLSTYGSYTCFAPTDKAIEEFLEARYQEYYESVKLHEADPENYKVINTGVTSPYLEDLSDSMATVIAKNHIIEAGFSTIDIGEGTFGQKTMNRRNVTLGVNKANEPTIDGYRIVAQDVKTENGYIQGIDGVLAPSDKMTSDLLAMQPAFSLFSEALARTGFDEILMQLEIDPDYDPNRSGPPFNTCNREEEPPYPAFYNHGFTLLVETDELLADSTKNALRTPILTIEDLEWYAAQWYGKNVDKEKKTFDFKGQYHKPGNPLYQYIAYHIIDRKLTYKSGKGPGGFIMEGFQSWKDDPETKQKVVDKGEYDSEENLKGFDRYDYFETMLPYTQIKVTKPFSNVTGQYINHCGETGYLKDQIILNYAQDNGTRMCVNDSMEYHVNVVVENEATTKLRPRLEEFQFDSPNGSIFTIDKILIYNKEEMAGNILYERMRWDVSSLFPELTTNDVRWQPIPLDKSFYTIYIPAGYCKRLRHRNESTHFLYYRPYNVGLGSGYTEEVAPGNGGGYANYMGDEILVIGKYDFEYRIPYVPEGRYEIRFGFSTSGVRGVAQFYFDDKICGIPLDMRNSNFNFFGWVKESNSEDENRKNDKSMRNRGFMKAPASIFGQYGSADAKSLRHAPTAFRRIIGTFDLEYGKDYWLRFKDVTEGSSSNGANEFNQDYLEIVPVEIVNGVGGIPEDIY